MSKTTSEERKKAPTHLPRNARVAWVLGFKAAQSGQSDNPPYEQGWTTNKMRQSWREGFTAYGENRSHN